MCRPKPGEALLIATQPGVSYSEHNLSKEKTLTRMQLWLDACPQRENPLVQKIDLKGDQQQLIASPDGQQRQLAVTPAGVAAPYRTEKR